MERKGKKNLNRLLSMLLAAILLLGALPMTVFAKETDAPSAAESAASEECAVIVHGGIIENEKSGASFDGTAKPGTTVRITPDETAFAGHTFVCWKGDDGTVIPRESFRLLVERSCAFYPVFSDLTGSFGDWKVLIRGELCTDGTIYVREDASTGLKQYRYREGNHDYQCAEIDGETHKVTCTRCPYTATEEHSWNSGEITTEPTHTTPGVKTFSCYSIGCTATKTEVLPAQTDSHSFPAYPEDEDWVVIREPDGTTPGLHALKCLYCDETQEPVSFIRSKLPDGNIKLTYKQNTVSVVDTTSREEEHYISDNAYFFYINRNANPYNFGFLWVDEGENSPVYIRSDERYGTEESLYYGILCYVDNRREFLDAISHQLGVYAYNNGRDVSHLYSVSSGYRAFENTYNTLARGGMLDEKLTMAADYQQYSFWNEPLRKYEYKYSSIKTIVYYVDANNACIRQEDGSDVMQILTEEPLETFPYDAPDRSKVTFYNYYVYDGQYGNNYYDGANFGMASPNWSDEQRRLTPDDSRFPNKAFDHWEKLDPRTGEWRFLSDARSYVPSVSDVTVIRPVYRDITYRVKVNGGYYQEVISGDWTTAEEKCTDGYVKTGTRIQLSYDPAQVPEGKQFDTFVDANGSAVAQWFTPTADGEYTATYADRTLYLNAYAANGSVCKDGEVFNWGEFKIGDTLTLTTEKESEEYPYFLGWYLQTNDETGEPLEVLLSADTTLTYTVPAANSVNLIARWYSAPQLPNDKFTIQSTNGFLRSRNGLAVSDLQVPNSEGFTAVKDPNDPLVIKRWSLIGTLEDGSAFNETRDCSGADTFIWLENDVDGGGKGGDGKGGQQQFPWNITVTGEADICTDHPWDGGAVTKQPTYTADGEMTYTCTVCGTQKTERIPMLPQYCVHACGHCGGCTLDDADTSCDFARCTCGSSSKLTAQNDQTVIDFNYTGSGDLTPKVYTVVDLGQTENPYMQYVLKAAEGYEVEGIYDISFADADGNKFTPSAGETVTITLRVGAANAQAIRDGRMNIIHITDDGNEIYGLNGKAIETDVDAGTVTFTVDSFSPFVLVRSAVEYYGRAALAKQTNGTALLYAYDRIVAGVGSCEADISFDSSLYELNIDDLKTVLDAYRRDHTEHFWFGNRYTCSSYSDGKLSSMSPEYTMSDSELETAKAAFDAAAAELLSGITSSMSEYDREKTLHDRLAARVSYVDGANAHNAYGALVEGKAVCEGYAEAYQYLLQRAGLQSFIVIGSSSNPATGASEGHAWNIVRVDGKYYHVDLTWDDQGESLFYAYFNKTDSRITEDHVITTTEYDLPVCDSETADYFTISGGKLEAFDAAAIGTMLKNGSGTARVFIAGDKATFVHELGKEESIRQIAQSAGIGGGFSWGYSNLGREFILTLSVPGVTVSGTVTSFGDAGEKTTVTLLMDGAVKDTKEVSDSYSFDGVLPGSYTVQVMKTNHVTREYAVTVESNPVTQDVKICLLGDVTGDGKVNTRDWQRIYLHVNETEPLTDYALACADVNGDKKVNTRDWQRIYLHVNETEPLF